MLGAGALSIVMWIMPELRPLLWPITIFNTYIHELSHAVATVLTLGSVERILVQSDGSGVTYSLGGWLPVIASAGYIGSSLVGAATLYFSRTKESARVILVAFAVVLVVALALVVRGSVIGYVMGVAWALGLGAAARWLKGDWLIFTARLLGFQLCLTSIQALSDLVVLSRLGTAATDAHNLRAATGISEEFWAYVWAVTACCGMFIGLVHAWKREDRPIATSRPSPLH